MSWAVRVAQDVKQDVSRLPPDVAEEAVAVIGELWEDPFPSGSLKMRGYSNRYRIRFGAYRIIYKVDRQRKSVTVLRVRPRSTAYRGMRNP
jgi:mRNA interferase RelE/StbE